MPAYRAVPCITAGRGRHHDVQTSNSIERERRITVGRQRQACDNHGTLTESICDLPITNDIELTAATGTLPGNCHGPRTRCRRIRNEENKGL